LTYAKKYAKKGQKAYIVMTAVALGNPFPVVEHPFQPGSLMGQSSMEGYQSHYTVG